MLPRFSSFLLPLCLLISPVLLSTIPAPTNISVTCHNFKNVLYWNYSEPDLQPEFNITINGYASEPRNLLTNQTYLDISEYTQKNEYGYYVTVEAQAKGSELRSSSQEITFSYNENESSDVTCMMDFPVIEFSVLQHTVDFSFSHPFNVYNISSLEGTFYYTVSFNGIQSKFNCNDDEDEECSGGLPLTDSLNGRCMPVDVRGAVNGISAKTSEEVCSEVRPNDPDWAVLVTILLCSGGALLFLIILAVVVYIKLTRPDSQSTIISKLLGMVNSDHVVHVPEHADVTEVMSIGQTPLLETCDPDLSNSSSPVFDSAPTHIPDQFDPDIKQSEDEEFNDEDGNSGGFNSGNSFSGYDSQKFPIDMGQGDIVEAYGPR